jgi:hypothetical protein
LQGIDIDIGIGIGIGHRRAAAHVNIPGQHGNSTICRARVVKRRKRVSISIDTNQPALFEVM